MITVNQRTQIFDFYIFIIIPKSVDNNIKFNNNISI